jgi:transcriptional regulator with XRE-family HTH domain
LVGRANAREEAAIRSIMQSNNRFCELMIKARKAAGLTQRKLADRLHKPQSFVAKYEGGERRIDVVEFLTVCQAMRVDPAKLLKELKNAIAKSNQKV